MSNFYGATSLTGGATGALDAIGGADLVDGDGAVVITDGVSYSYHLDATSAAAESSPAVISPDADAGDKRWILTGVRANTLTLAGLLTGVAATLSGLFTASFGAVFGKTVTFSSLVDNGNSGAAKEINWTEGNKQKITLDDNVTLTFVNPAGPCNLTFKIIQDAGGANTITWPGGILWTAQTEPTISAAGDSIDIITFFYDGAIFHGMLAPDFG